MNEPKVIELNDEQRVLINASLNTAGYVGLPDGDVLLKVPQPKLVHLSDLPDGTRVRNIAANEWLYKEGSTLYEFKDAMGDYRDVFSYIADFVEGAAFELIQGEWQVWQGGECPWPEHVEVEALYRNKTTKVIHGFKRYEDWRHYKTAYGDDIIAHRCTGRLLDGAKLVP